MTWKVKLIVFASLVNFASGQLAEEKATRLKTELLANLNKYSTKASDSLEVLGSPPGALTEEVGKRNQIRVNPVTEPPRTLLPTPGLDVFNLFNPQPPSILTGLPNIFNRLLSFQHTTPPNMMGIQPFPFGRAIFKQHEPATTTVPPMITFPTMPTLIPRVLPNNGVLRRNPDLNESPSEPLSAMDNEATVTPKYLNHSTTPASAKSLSESVAENIRDWRLRFYKALKKISGKYNHPTTTTPGPVDPRLDIRPLSRPKSSHSSRMQPVVVLNDTKAPEVDKNKQVILSRKNPNWVSEQKVKTYARDSKGRIVRLFGIESSEYRYGNNATYPNTNGFIPIPESPSFTAQNVDIGPVYIPAARPTTEPPVFYPQTAPPVDPVLANYVTPPAPQIYTVAMPAPPSIAPVPYTLASYPDTTTFAAPLPPPSDAQLTNEVDTMDYEPMDTPCGNGCQSDDWSNEMMENNEKCNSLRLRYIIQESIINSDAEASKRAIQTRAELELGTFYNVICGTGFFSYIAHTDEFCQASSMGINCYVFSPVCSLRIEMATGIAKKKFKKRKKVRAVVNRN